MGVEVFRLKHSQIRRKTKYNKQKKKQNKKEKYHTEKGLNGRFCRWPVCLFVVWTCQPWWCCCLGLSIFGAMKWNMISNKKQIKSDKNHFHSNRHILPPVSVTPSRGNKAIPVPRSNNGVKFDRVEPYIPSSIDLTKMFINKLDLNQTKIVWYL